MIVEPKGGALVPWLTAAVVLSLAMAAADPTIVAVAALLGALLCNRARAAGSASTAESEANGSVQDQLRRKDEQLANTVHELRTPLTSVITAIEMLRDGYADSPADREMCLTQAVVAARHLSFLINDVLDLTALESGRLGLNVRDHYLHELLVDVNQVMGLAAGANGVELVVEEPAREYRLRTDRGRFLQITFNLVGNAIKYSPQGGKVHLRMGEVEGGLRFEILDAGEGVPPQTRARLFTRFGRAPTALGSDIRGTGLGLYLCKQLVALLRGEIGYLPRATGGSVFWFELPLSSAAVASATIGGAAIEGAAVDRAAGDRATTDRGQSVAETVAAPR